MKNSGWYRFVIAKDVPLDEARETLHLAVLAAEGVHGRADVRVDARLTWDMASRTCDIDGFTAAGKDVVKIFASLLEQEYGVSAFTIEKVSIGRVVQPAKEDA